MDCSLSRSSVHGILQTRILEWVAIPFSRGYSRHKDQTWVSYIAGWFFTTWTTREAPEPLYIHKNHEVPQWALVCMAYMYLSICCSVTKSCLTLSDSMDYSQPGSSVHGILQQEDWVGCYFLHQGLFLTQGSNLCLLLAGGFFTTKSSSSSRQILYHWATREAPK